MLGAASGDAALVHSAPPSEFLDYLGECGLHVPRVLLHPQIDAKTRLRPFGWNAEAMVLNGRHIAPVPTPPAETIRRVNSRSFALELEVLLAPETADGTIVRSLSELNRHLARAPLTSEWVIKAEHGNAALANRRLRHRDLTEADRHFVMRRLADDDCLLVEPWKRRERDWCVVFDVPFAASSLRIHETIGTRDGALIGALFEPGGASTCPWADELSDLAKRVAARLAQEGYFGPVCVDAFSWYDGDRLRLRPLVDVNCRRSMSDGAYRTWRQLAPERVFYYRFLSQRKFTLPSELATLRGALGAHQYDPAHQTGIFIASPPRLRANGVFRKPGKLAIVLAADDRAGVFAKEHWLRRRFEKRLVGSEEP